MLCTRVAATQAPVTPHLDQINMLEALQTRNSISWEAFSEEVERVFSAAFAQNGIESCAERLELLLITGGIDTESRIAEVIESVIADIRQHLQ